MKYKVIKEFPGLKVGDVLIEEEGTGFYINKKEEVDISEDNESLYINSVAFSKDIVENEKEFFEPVETKRDTKDSIIDEMAQVASLLEADLITAINEYHFNLISEMIEKVYKDINLLSKHLK